MTRVIIIGGHGKVALLLAPILVEQGVEVSSVIRNADQSSAIEGLGAQAVVADVESLDTQALAQLIAGFDAVVWTAGAGGGNPTRTYAVDRDAAIRTIDAAAQAGTRRFVMVSYFNASPQHGISPEHSFFHYAEAKAAADVHLRESSLDWTILGPSGLTLEPATGRIDTAATESGTVSRGNVALTIAATLSDDSTIHRTIRFNDGDTSIAEAVARERPER